MNADSGNTHDSKQGADQLVSDCEAVEPALKLPACSRSRSKLFQCRPSSSHCLIDHATDICTQCYDDDEICGNNNLTAGAERTDSPARPAKHLIDIDHLHTSPSVLMCRGIYTDDETEINSTPPCNSVSNSITHTSAEAVNVTVGAQPTRGPASFFTIAFLCHHVQESQTCKIIPVFGQSVHYFSLTTMMRLNTS